MLWNCIKIASEKARMVFSLHILFACATFGSINYFALAGEWITVSFKTIFNIQQMGKVSLGYWISVESLRYRM